MLKIKTFTTISAEELGKLQAEQKRSKPRWLTIAIDDWDKGVRSYKAKLLDPVWLVINWGERRFTHYLLSDDLSEVKQMVGVNDKYETVERNRNGDLLVIPRRC